jgi:probable rRNA maturation factor
MSFMVNVLISADSRFPISRPKIKQAVEELLLQKKITSDVEVSVLVCGSRKSRELAKKYLSDDAPHNVLSFPLANEGEGLASPTGRSARGFVEFQSGQLILGDIVVCYPVAQEEASNDNMMVNDKISELVQHGLLHLLGEHHDDDR